MACLIFLSSHILSIEREITQNFLGLADTIFCYFIFLLSSATLINKHNQVIDNYWKNEHELFENKIETCKIIYKINSLVGSFWQSHIITHSEKGQKYP